MTKEEFFHEANATTTGPLDGMLVLEACTTYAGPVAAAELADLGAEVIKCELPGSGDVCRAFAPRVPGAPDIDSSAPFLSINRNKKAITLNFHHAQGQALFRQLAQRADIVVQNFRPGTMDKWHIGYADIQQVKPDIVYVSISCLGQWGPLSHKVGYDVDAQAMGGLMSITGLADGPPLKTGNATADYLTGIKAAQAGLAAVVRRLRTGQGQHVEIAMVDAILSITEAGIMQAATCGEVWQRDGNRHPAVAPVNTFSCMDGYIILAIAHAKQWQKLCTLIGREDLVDDARTASAEGRKLHEALIEEAIGAWTKTLTVCEAVAQLNAESISASPIYGFDDIIQEEHFKVRDMVCEVEHPTAGNIAHYGVAPKFARTPARIRTPAPLLGQDNAEVYGSLGYSEEALEELRQEGVI